MSKPRLKPRLVAPNERPLAAITLAEKRAAIGRDFKAEPWIMGEGARFFTPERVAQMAYENEQRRRKK